MTIDFIYYDLKVAALLFVFYLFYQLLLARETTHTLNRMVLLMAIGLSLVLPLCVVKLHETQVVESIPQMVAETATRSDSPTMIANSIGQNLLWEWLLLAVLATGMAVRLFYILHGYRKLRRLIASGERHTLPSGIEISVVEAPVAPFSWMHTVVLPRSEWLSPSPSVLAHEDAHVRHRHSYDVVVVEVLTALQWFNPVVWLMRQELRTLHEYEADASVLSRGFSESQYIHLLMQKATGIQACVLANGISTHRTKKRILMMLKPKSRRTAWLKALYVVPIVLASLAMSAKTVVDYQMATTEENLKSKDDKTIYIIDGERVSQEDVDRIKKKDIATVEVIKNKEWLSANAPEASSAVIIRTKESDGPIFDICEQMPSFPGGDAKLMEFIARNIKYPKVATEWGVMGRVIVKFVVEKNGRITSPQAINITDLDEPSGIAVTAYCKDMTEEQRKDADAQDAGLRAGAQALKDEAVRVVKAMPKWTPGKQNGKPVRAYFSIPVTYRLN